MQGAIRIPSCSRGRRCSVGRWSNRVATSWTRRRSFRERAPWVRRPLSGSGVAVSSFRQYWVASFGSLDSNVSVSRIDGLGKRRLGCTGNGFVCDRSWRQDARHSGPSISCRRIHLSKSNLGDARPSRRSGLGLHCESVNRVATRHGAGLFTMFSSSIVELVARQVTGEYNIRARRENSRPATVFGVN